MHTLIAKKRFGQNFLVDTHTLDKIEGEVVKLLRDHHIKHVIEIGPGTGQLTHILLRNCRSVHAIEIDEDVIDIVSNRFRDDIARGYLTLYHGDAVNMVKELDIIFESVVLPNTALIANLPFNIGSRLLVDLGVVASNIPFLVILQKEVAEKVRQESDITFFGAWLQYIWNCRIVFDISKHAFNPQPDVVSALLRGDARDHVAGTTMQRMQAKKILKVLFAHPRKTVHSNLKYAGWDNDRISRLFVALNADSDIRVTWANYITVLEACMTVDN